MIRCTAAAFSSAAGRPASGLALAAGARELRQILLAARGPAALLHAERGDGHAAGIGWQQEAHRQHAVLLAALDDVTRLDEHLLRAGVLDLKLVDLSGLDHLHLAFAQRLLQGEGNRAADADAMHEVDCEICMHVRPRDARAGIGERGSAGEAERGKCGCG
jgi:hypothetical protein